MRVKQQGDLRQVRPALRTCPVGEFAKCLRVVIYLCLFLLLADVHHVHQQVGRKRFVISFCGTAQQLKQYVGALLGVRQHAMRFVDPCGTFRCLDLINWVCESVGMMLGTQREEAMAETFDINVESLRQIKRRERIGHADSVVIHHHRRGRYDHGMNSGLLSTLCVLVFVVMGAFARVVAADVVAAEGRTELDVYVARPDDSYAWVKRDAGTFAGCEFAELTLTSQTWRGVPWKHRLFLVKPPVIQSGHGLMVVGGGRWHDKYAAPPARGPGVSPNLPDEATIIAAAATMIGSPIAVVLHVPHQPLFGDMVEDRAIAYTFDRYLQTQDPDWPLLLPMVKSVVRAMDATSEYCRKTWSMKVDRFTVTGASKRGWTTWLTAAVDPRVAGIIPMVFDVLDVGMQLRHQADVWGRVSHKIHDYTELNLHERLQTPPGEALLRLVDPFAYRHRITQPKLIVLGTNDQYWPLDALAGDKRVMYVPNAGHELADWPRVVGAIVAGHLEAGGRFQMPEFTWQHEENGDGETLTMRSDVLPTAVLVWQTTSDTRDFRAAQWAPTSVTRDGDAYTMRITAPEQGYAAVFGEAMYNPGAWPLYLSTTVRILSSPQGAS